MPCTSCFQMLDIPVGNFSVPRVAINNIQNGRSSKVGSKGFHCFLNVEENKGNKRKSGGCSPSSQLLHKTLPLAASLSILLWSIPANAGLFSGFSGMESISGPQLPEIDFLKRLNEENQKKYAELDSRFKSSPLLQQLLEKSKLNKERNRQRILDKYCERGAEWGVGDCSTQGMTPDEREAFIKILKENSTAR